MRLPAGGSSTRFWVEKHPETLSGHADFVLVEDGRPTHLYLATGDGPPGFESMKRTAMTRTWNMVIPLR